MFTKGHGNPRVGVEDEIRFLRDINPVIVLQGINMVSMGIIIPGRKTSCGFSFMVL